MNPGESELRPDSEGGSTVAYYNADADAYAKRTLSSDLSEVYPLFLEHVPDGGLILDAGCGAGRDILEFLSRGYRVEAFDASDSLASIAKELSGVPVDVIRFEDWEGRESRYDGIWCFASLLHVARNNLREVLTSLGKSLKPGAPLFASFKCEERQDHIDELGRQFTNFSPDTMRSLLTAIDNLIEVDIRLINGPTAFDERARWLYVLAKRND